MPQIEYDTSPAVRYSQMAKALRLARPMIESGREKYICCALAIVPSRYPLLEAAAVRVQRWIGATLGPYVAYEQLVCETILGYCPSPERARLGRLAWIDWMISELEKE